MTDGQDDIETIMNRLENSFNSAKAVQFNPETNDGDEEHEHIGYWDKSRRLCDTGAIEYIQSQGFTITMLGTNSYGDDYLEDRQRPWFEARRREAENVFGDGS